MFPENRDRQLEVEGSEFGYTPLPLAFVVQPDIKLIQMLADLSPEKPWGNRKEAAHKLGHSQAPEALAGLLEALPADPFWMVRCAIIQALERIGNPEAVPTLREIARADGFQTVRSFAARAVERLSPQG